MSYRSISFFIYFTKLACFSESYGAVFSENIVQDDSGKLPIPAKSPSILNDLAEQAMMIEWKREVRNAFSKEEQVIGADTWCEDEKKFLIDKGPQNIAASCDNLKLKFIIRTLEPKASRILARKTIFCLPENLSANQDNKWLDLIEKIAEQLHVQLKNQPELSYAFLREGKREEGKSMMDELLKLLHSHIAGAGLSDLATNQQGPILLCGPTGTGKSHATKLLTLGKKTPFVPVNLTAVTEALMESRMRGYNKGTFTGGNPNGDSGWFEQAHEGVLFLDEFQSVSIACQTQFLDLLKAVSDQISVARIGSDNKPNTFTVKVILAVNEDLKDLIAQGRLRKDLFFRMRKIIHFSPLKDRFVGDDGKRLLQIILKTYRWESAPTIPENMASELGIEDMHCLFPNFEPDALSEFVSHDWPGNLRELQRVACDLYWQCDKEKNPVIDKASVRKAISIFDIWIKKESVERGDSLSIEDKDILTSVERALRQSGFVIKSTLPKLKRFAMGSRPPLRKYLIENKNNLSPDITKDSRIRNFMKLDVKAAKIN
jgi:DNA-binding NtrC family response regulator